MATVFSIRATEVAAPTTAGAAINVSGARYVRVVNTHATNAYLVSQVKGDGGYAGTITLAGATDCIIKKDATDELWSANAAVKFSKIANPEG